MPLVAPTTSTWRPAKRSVEKVERMMLLIADGIESAEMRGFDTPQR
jgi:hypothetical protein